VANPFSGTITGKNTGHANQANLVYAVIPRSSSVIKEIISDTTTTISGAAGYSYNANGYWIGGSASSLSVGSDLAVTGFANSAAHTVIAGFAWMGGSPTSSDALAGMYRNAETYVQSYAAMMDGFAKRLRQRMTDGTRDWIMSWITPTNSFFASALISSGTAQSGYYYDGTAPEFTGTSTAFSDTGGTMAGGTMDRLYLAVNSSWGVQYLFVYNTNLSQADVEAIMKNPGAVVNQTGTFQPRRMMLGVG
jgi:hypothetical protein